MREGHTYNVIIIVSEQSTKVFSAKFSFCIKKVFCYTSVLPRPFWHIGPISLTCGRDIGRYALCMYSASAARSYM